MAVNEEPLRIFRPKWPSRQAIDPGRVAFTYDHLSDTLFVDLFGRAMPAVSVPAELEQDDVDVYLRVDAATEEVLGLQIEGVLAGGARLPWIGEALGLAERRDIEPATASNRIGGATPIDKRAVVGTLLDAVAPVAV
ncbi:MAG: hypothetical protein M3Q10_02045 [Chloroflexota bacterium]|nr:hypothetical protein [Chloroflexota bacterium]